MINGYKTGNINKDEYSEQYINLLKNRAGNPECIYETIPDSAILLCYEKPGEFCHRRVLAEWLEDALDIQIPEWVNEEEAKKEIIVDCLLDF